MLVADGSEVGCWWVGSRSNVGGLGVCGSGWWDGGSIFRSTDPTDPVRCRMK